MIPAHHVRDLDLALDDTHEGLRWLSAASGLVQVQDHLYVIADDEHHLGIFPLDPARPGTLLRLLPGTLPDKPKPRKARKPDFETLLSLPAFAHFPAGALLTLGSGSRPNRDTGVLIGLDDAGAVSAAPVRVDLTAMYTSLRTAIDKLNIEGAAIVGEQLVLLQRGNKGAANALITAPLAPFLDDLAHGHPPAFRAPPLVHPIDLPRLDGIPLGFTDAAALPDGTLLFTAAAEDTDDSYQDGACGGSVVGTVDLRGRTASIRRLAGRHKVEGVSVWVRGDGVRLLLVTDADDRGAPGRLMEASWEFGG